MPGKRSLSRELFQTDDTASTLSLADQAGDACRRIGQTILELTAAALGKIETRTVLEQQITLQHEHMTNTAAAMPSNWRCVTRRPQRCACCRLPMC